MSGSNKFLDKMNRNILNRRIIGSMRLLKRED
jgi:hypothetical protein